MRSAPLLGAHLSKTWSSKRRLTVAALASALAMLAMVPAAANATLIITAPSAATPDPVVHIEPFPADSPTFDFLAVSRPGGDSTKVTFQITSGGETILTDNPAPCAPQSSQNVTCDFDGPISALEIVLGGGNDTASSTAPYPTEWDAGPGNDTITGSIAPDTMIGGIGTDILNGGPNGDHLNGGPGTDTLIGDTGTDTLIGGTEADNLSGGVGADDLSGGAGPDILDGGSGPDVLAGGSEQDTATFADRSEPLVVTIDGVANDGGASDSNLEGVRDNVRADVEKLIGGTQDDHLTAGSGGTTIDGGPGNDTLTGSVASDHFAGSGGSDTITTGSGNDTVDGGPGNDVIDVGPDNDLVFAGAGDDIVIGGDGSDSLFGDDDNDLINGGIGDDNLVGDSGDDEIRGGPGFDKLRGLDGADALDSADGAVDELIDCGADLDSASTDSIDPTAIECESEDRREPADPGGPGGPGDGGGDPAGGAASLGRFAGKKVPVRSKRRRGARTAASATLVARPKLRCPSSSASPCQGRIVLRAKKASRSGARLKRGAMRTIGAKRYSLSPGQRKRVNVKLKRAGTKVLRKRRRVKGKAVLKGTGKRSKKVIYVRKR